MAQTPEIKSQEQLLGEMLADFISRTGVNDINVGSLTTQFFEVIALAAARSSGDTLQILRDLSVDRASGQALRRIAADERLRELPSRVATGVVTVTDTSFSKISTKVYAGSRPPNIGSVTIDVSDASSFPSSGSVYIGRNTPNIEGPLSYSSKTQIGGFWRLSLVSPTTKFHNISETVILSQGGTRNIGVGTVVKAPASGATPDINFTVTQSAIILDGETTIDNVSVSAQQPGTNGNVPIGAIKEFSSPPFSGATVKNLLPFKTGRDVETDEELRIRIKRARLSKGLGTATAVKNAVIGATPSDENTTLTAAQIITSGGQTTMFVDDNTGYEQKTSGVGIESIVDSALGGETDFQLETGGRQTSVSKAFLLSNLSAPFDIRESDKLAISVGEITTEHSFLDSDFVSPGGATAYEIVSSINANSDLNFEAATAEGGTKVVISAKSETRENLQAVDVTSGRNAMDLLGLAANEIQTLRLFKNKKPLSKDGLLATVKSERQVNWSNLLATGDTLIISVDGTAFITYTITDADFIQEGTHASVSSTNSLESWVNVLNSKITGATASIVGEQIYISSNLGASNRSKIEISPSSTLVSKNLFSTSQGLVSVGRASDYTFSRNTAQIKLAEPLSAGDELTAGTRDTEARIENSRVLGGNITFTSPAYMWILVDDQDASKINTGVVASTVLSVSKPAVNILRYTSSSPSAFANVQVGDYVIIWSEELSATNRLEARVNAITATTLDVKVTAAEFSAAVVETGILFNEGFSVLRTSKVPQKLKVTVGTKTLGQIADELNLQTKSAQFSVVDEEILVIKTLTRDVSGSVLVVTFDEAGKQLNFTEGQVDSSKDSLLAFYESGYSEGSIPSFVHSSFSGEASANPPDSFISTISSVLNPSTLNLDPNKVVGFLNPYGPVLDALSPSEKTLLDNYSGSTLTLDQDSLIKRLRANDRYYFSQPLDFGHQDEAVVVLDGDASNKTFPIPFYRRATTNTSLAVNSSTFNAYDTDGGLTTPFTQFFGNNFDFSNFKVLMQAKRVINTPVLEDAILFRSQSWGRSGERINIGYSYPTAPDAPVQHTNTVDENINLRISLKSGAAVPSSIDGTTEWNVTITPNVPVAGVDQVTYTYSGTGTAPNLAALSGGEYVNIVSGSELSPKNTGVFRISTQAGFNPTSTSFTVVRKSGEAVAESNRATLVPNVFSFYLSSPTTAAEIVAYVSSSSLLDMVSATLVNDGGTSGSGVIALSTAEQNNFSSSSFFLLDGINWISLSSISSSPQFTLKRTLAYPSDTGYAFNAGEQLRIVPVSIEQCVRFTNILAVTGYSTLGSISLSARESKMVLSTGVLGGNGSVQVVGGSGNSSTTVVLDTSVPVNNRYALTSIPRAGLAGFHSDQIIKLAASFKQYKETLFKETASVSIDGDFGAIGKSRIRFSGRTLTDRHFGNPRNHTRTRLRSFKVEKQGSFTCISWDNTGTQPFFSKALNVNAGSGTLDIVKILNSSEVNMNILSGPVNFTEVSIGDIVSVSGMINPENNGSFLVTGVSLNGKTLRVLNGNAVEELASSYNSSSFSCTSSVSEGDNVVLSSPFNVLNQGKFRVVRRYENSIYIENTKSVEEQVTMPANLVSLSYSPTTSFDVLATNNRLTLRWNGTGTEPTLGSCRPGDEITLGTDFLLANRGTFMITKAETKLPEITRATLVAANLITSGDYWLINAGANTTQYYVWYNVDSAGGDPLLSGKTGIEVAISSTDTAIQVANATFAAIDANVDFSATVSSNIVVVTASASAETTDAAVGTMDPLFDIEILQQGQRTFIEAINPAVVAQSGVTVTGTLEVHRPQILFFEYEATVPGDKFMITSNFLSADNQSSWVVSSVLDQDTIIVNGTMLDVESTSLFNEEESVLVEEEIPYVGYKKILAAVNDPNSTDRGLVLFDTVAQSNKISDTGGVQLITISKLGFDSALKKGLDSYRFHTGLIAEANRITYGDPRDPVTYPGNSAAGSDIFIREPLFRRVKVSVNVRVETGIPFAQIIEQVRTNLTALIDGNALGNSIAISDIVESVNTIPGVKAVAISSPLYNAANDTIRIGPSEKSRIIDSVADISVLKIGN